MNNRTLLFILVLVFTYMAVQDYYKMEYKIVWVNETRDEFYYFDNNIVNTSDGEYEFGHPYNYADQKWEVVNTLKLAPRKFLIDIYGWEIKVLNIHKKIQYAMPI